MKFFIQSSLEICSQPTPWVTYTTLYDGIVSVLARLPPEGGLCDARSSLARHSWFIALAALSCSLLSTFISGKGSSSLPPSSLTIVSQ